MTYLYSYCLRSVTVAASAHSSTSTLPATLCEVVYHMLNFGQQVRRVTVHDRFWDPGTRSVRTSSTRCILNHTKFQLTILRTTQTKMAGATIAVVLISSALSIVCAEEAYSASIERPFKKSSTTTTTKRQLNAPRIAPRHNNNPPTKRRIIAKPSRRSLCRTMPRPHGRTARSLFTR